MKRGEPANKLIRDTTCWYNSIEAQWDKFVNFVLKTETSNEDSILDFMNLLIQTIEINFQQKSTWILNSNFIMDIARINKTKKVTN